MTNNLKLINYGYLLRKIPNTLLASLKQECREASILTHKPLISGLSDRHGIPAHFLVNDKESVQHCVSKLSGDFLEEYKEAYDMKFKSDGTVFKGLYCGDPWINIQKAGDHIPNHDHVGFLSYTIWVNMPPESTFEFIYSAVTGDLIRYKLNLTKESEGSILIFPSKLVHCVYPFYNTNEKRASVSGNLYLRDS